MRLRPYFFPEKESRGEARIVGYYHSHPTGQAAASAEDRLAAVEGVCYLIVDLTDETVTHAAWRLEGAEMVEEAVEFVDGPDDDTVHA